MKTNPSFARKLKQEAFLLFSLVLAALGAGSNCNVQAQEKTNALTTAQNLVTFTQVYIFDRAAANFKSERDQLGAAMLEVFKDPKSSNASRCAAAYYLGEMRFTEAAGALAEQVGLQFDLSQFLPQRNFSVLDVAPVAEALARIGSASIPAVVRNLEESDDLRVRRLSLQVLSRIEGDKEILELRLKKAMDGQQDSEKKARLQAALNSLADPRFGK